MITSPYNFVPLNKDVYYPSWSEKVSQDLPFSDSEDGVIEVDIHTVSPFFTRDGEKQGVFSSHIMGADGQRHYFIPATTVKGMLREIVEIMSFGKMQEGKDYQNRYFGWRDVGKAMDKGKNNEYSDIVGEGKPGWLKKNETGEYVFTPCNGNFDKIQTGEVSRLFPSYRPDTSIWKVNASVKIKTDGKSPAYPKVEQNDQTYRLVCTGNIGGKLHELLFPAELGNEEKLSDETIAAFKTLYADTPGFAEEKEKGKGCYLQALEEGQEIPVFRYVRDGKTYLGMSRMFRVPFKYNVRDQVGFIQQAASDRADLAETLFGYAGREKSLKGRVSVGHAFMEGTVSDESLIKTSGILGSPKASYYPLYIRQDQSPYKTYDDKAGIAGRKLYRIHQGSTTTKLPEGENENVRTTFKALPQGQTFHLRIAMHNTRPVEIGAVLSALTLNGTEGSYLNLGMAKSFGFGKCMVRLKDIKLSGFKQPDAKHYMHEFEKEMTAFTYGNDHTYWAENKSVAQLVNILSEHSDEAVRMMVLTDYTDSKNEKKNPFTALQEKGNQINSWLTEEDWTGIKTKAEEVGKQMAFERLKSELASSYAEAERYIAEAAELEREKKYSDAINELRSARGSYDKIDAEFAKHQMQSDTEAYKTGIADKIKQLEELISVALSGGNTTLGEDLDKRKPDGSYMRTAFKSCFQCVASWTKKNGPLSPEDKAALEKTVRRLLDKPDKEDKKTLGDFSQKPWTNLRQYLDEPVCRSLYDDYVKSK